MVSGQVSTTRVKIAIILLVVVSFATFGWSGSY